MQFWPRKRAKKSAIRIRSWAKESKAKLLGFIGYKAGMTQLLVDDSRSKSMTKGQTIALPSTIIECPPMTVFGVAFYKNSKNSVSILNQKLAKELSRKIQLPKDKKESSIKDSKNKMSEPDSAQKFPAEFDDLRLLVHSNPKRTGIGTKRPKVMEMALGGSKEDKLVFAQENLGKEIKIEDVFEKGILIDVHGITKGKGFQGTVKRYGVPIRQHKAEKTKRGIGNLGSWTPKRVEFTVAQSGKMGYHLRTEYNMQIVKIGREPNEVVPKSGLTKYGNVKNPYVLIKGSVAGPRKRALIMTQAIRPNKQPKEGLDVVGIRK